MRNLIIPHPAVMVSATQQSCVKSNHVCIVQHCTHGADTVYWADFLEAFQKASTYFDFTQLCCVALSMTVYRFALSMAVF
jgi:hypothetical protein